MGEKSVFSTNGPGTTGYMCGGKKITNPYHLPYLEIK